MLEGRPGEGRGYSDTHCVEMSDAGGYKQELDTLESSKGEGVNGLDGVVIDDQHGNILRGSKCISRQSVNPDCQY